MKTFKIWEAYNEKGEYQGYFLWNELEMAQAINPDWTFKAGTGIWG